MLVLERRLRERILIGDDIEVIIIDVAHLRVKLGIQAPMGVRIIRSELAAHGSRTAKAVGDGPAA